MAGYVDVVIMTPGSSMHPAYVKSLVRTCALLDDLEISYKFVSRYSSSVATARELTALDSDFLDFGVRAKVAGKEPSEYGCLFWIDSDISWEPGDFVRLYRQVVAEGTPTPILSGLYQLDRVGSVAATLFNVEGRQTRMNKVEFLLRDDVVDVDGVGFGFLCVRSGVFEAMPREWFATSKWVVDGGVTVNVGEDYSWCESAVRAGFKIKLDASVKVVHHKETVFIV